MHYQQELFRKGDVNRYTDKTIKQKYDLHDFFFSR